MNKRTLIVVIMTLFMGVLNIGSALCGICDIISFTLTPTHLQTVDPTVPVTWQATIHNMSTQWFAYFVDSQSNPTYGFNWLYPDPGVGTVTFAATIPLALGPGDTYQGNFATFDFDDMVAMGTKQTIQFYIAGGSSCPKGQFETKYQIGTATLVPEPSSLLLLFGGLLGLAGYRVIKRRKAA